MNRQRFIQLAIAIYIISGLTLLLGERSWFPNFYNPGFMGTLALASAAAIILPKLVFEKSDDLNKREALLNFQVTISLLLNGAGGLGLYQLYQHGFEYDKLMHFLVPAMFTASGARFISIWFGTKIEKALLLSAILVISGSLAWEVFEFLSDWYIGTQTLGFYGEEITKDTIIDIIANTIGIIFGSIFMLRKK
jgi:hypothetical protein